MKTLTLMTVALVLGSGCAAGQREAASVAPAVRGAPTVAEAKALGFPACETEDSCGCYWDAATMGNGKGRSFVAPPCEVSGAEEEARCMGVAERAYELAAGAPMTGFGDAPVPDAAYEDAYAECIRTGGEALTGEAKAERDLEAR